MPLDGKISSGATQTNHSVISTNRAVQRRLQVNGQHRHVISLAVYLIFIEGQQTSENTTGKTVQDPCVAGLAGTPSPQCMYSLLPHCPSAFALQFLSIEMQYMILHCWCLTASQLLMLLLYIIT